VSAGGIRSPGRAVVTALPTVELEDAGSDRRVGTEPVRPALRRRHRRWWLAALLAVVLYASGVVAVHALGRSTPATDPHLLPAALDGRSGQLLVMNSDGTLESTDPGGDNTRLLSNLGTFQDPTEYLAEDQRLFAITSGGQLDSVMADRPVIAPIPLGRAVTGGAGSDPFADRDRALVILVPPAPGEQASFELLTLATAATVPLGRGDQAAGDPQTPGAFVSVAGAVQPGLLLPAGSADDRVELRVPGRTPVVVTTADQLRRATGQSTTAGVQLAAYPDPAGDKLAVVLDPLGIGDADAAMVVVSRTGKVLGSVDATSGPTANVAPAWSPDGTSLAYTTFGSHGAALVVWTPGHAPKARLAPDPGDDFGGCLWAPAGDEILCVNVLGFEQSTQWGLAASRNQWVVGASGGGALYLSHAPGVPIAWLPGPIRV